MRKYLYSQPVLFILVLLVIGVTSIITLLINPKSYYYRPGISPEDDEAVRQAKVVFQEKSALGLDYTNGPCLTNDLMKNWVVDIVHHPRESIDDNPQYQCAAYIEGRAKRVVEMDQNGDIIRVY